MNWDLIFKGITLSILVTNNVALIVMYLRRRNDQRIGTVEAQMVKLKETDDQHGSKLSVAISERKEQHAEFKQRLALAEQSIRNMPTHEDLRRISERLGSLEKDVGSIDTKTDGIQETVNTIRDLLLEKGV